MARTTTIYQAMDIKAKDTYGPLINAERPQLAVRAFLNAVKDKTTLIGQYPDDFTFQAIATQDKDTGEVTPISPPEIIITGEAAVIMLSTNGNTNGEQS